MTSISGDVFLGDVVPDFLISLNHFNEDADAQILLFFGRGGLCIGQISWRGFGFRTEIAFESSEPIQSCFSAEVFETS